MLICTVFFESIHMNVSDELKRRQPVAYVNSTWVHFLKYVVPALCNQRELLSWQPAVDKSYYVRRVNAAKPEIRVRGKEGFRFSFSSCGVIHHSLIRHFYFYFFLFVVLQLA